MLVEMPCSSLHGLYMLLWKGVGLLLGHLLDVSFARVT